MNKEELRKALSSLGFDITDEKMENIEDCISKTLLTNEKFNLTAIKDEETFREKMVYDSALALVGLDISNKKCIDVGTGAGFPGLILYILNPETKMTLLDSTQKKINYLKDYSNSRNYKLDFIATRAEEYSQKNREIYDFAFARALSSLNILLELIIPMIKVNGYFIALKGANADIEINEAKNALKKMNCQIEEIKSYILPESKEERNILIIKKMDKSNRKYPRMYAEIKKSPL